MILRLEQSTEKFLRKAVREGLVILIRKKKRLKEEFLISFGEQKPIKVLKRMDELGILPE